jgi:hypothetical protein
VSPQARVQFSLVSPSFASSSSGRTTVSETVGRGSNPREASKLLPLRLTVGQRPLTPFIVVRIHEGQPIYGEWAGR